MLHFNKLFLQHVFQLIDGCTSGSDTFSESIGKQVSGFVSEWGITQFKAILNCLCPRHAPCTVEELGSDQYYAYKICTAIIRGNVITLCHSHLLTLECRVLRLHVSYANLPHALSLLAEIVIKVCFPSGYMPNFIEGRVQKCTFANFTGQLQ